MVKVGVNSFARSRHFGGSGYSQCNLGEGELLDILRAEMVGANIRRGYRDGVVLVAIPARSVGSFTTPLIELREGDKLEGSFVARRDGETPRQSIRVVREGDRQAEASRVDVVLYESRLLAEDGDNELPADTGNYEVVSINCSTYEGDGEEPMHPDTLMANHFGESGGTATNMSDEEFVAELRRAREFWKGRAFCTNN
jgi:hypothetical protein